MSRRNEWRDSARTVRFFFFDAKAGLAFFLFLAHVAWWTFALALVSFIAFGVLERYGFSIVVALRLARARLAGPVRYAVAWWQKPQRRFE